MRQNVSIINFLSIDSKGFKGIQNLRREDTWPGFMRKGYPVNISNTNILVQMIKNDY